jgi:hypothetical protein
MATPVSFANNILPLFTAIDISCMKSKGVNLSSYAYMSIPQNAQNVLDHLNGSTAPRMPPSGPWPPANIALFQSWIAGGYQP